MELSGHLAIIGLAVAVAGPLWLRSLSQAYRESHRT